MVKYLIYDTETTGLNIRTDKPFLFQYGLVDEKLNLIKTDVFDADHLISKQTFITYLKQVDTIVGHNIKFDMHMAINSDIPIELFTNKHYIDTAVLARLIISHDEQKDKTFSIALKKLALRYLGIDSADEERILKTELSHLTIAHKNKMKDYFISQGVWDTKLSNTKQTKLINKIYNKWTKIYHLYPQFKEHRKTFLKNNPAPTYADCSNVRIYGLTDIKLTHGLFKLWYPKVSKLKQVPTLKRISNVMFALMLMERKGMTINVQQILQDRNILIKEMSKTKIIDPRTGEQLSIGQHAKLKRLYEYESGQSLDSADKQTRSEIEDKSASAKTANYLAKMDKYLSTYITRILDKLCYVDGEYKVFTQYNLAGTITGRLSSDFQQFPRDPLVLHNGYEINIRSWFIVPKDNQYMFYFDYSQMELRLQCEWTNIVNGSPDINMARAFSPYKCVKKNGKYYLEEDLSTEWTPTDLHGLTAKHAFPNIDESHSDWKHYRGLGKRCNFACNYGASPARIQQALKVDFKVAQALVKGYKRTFAGVVAFGKWLSNRTYVTPSIPNLLFRRYYSRNKHLMQNWLVQGSGADILLEKIYEVWLYIQHKPWWKLFITVHDEIGLTCDDIPKKQLNKEVKEIQKIMTYKLSAVDIITDVEYTETSWAAKKEWS